MLAEYTCNTYTRPNLMDQCFLYINFFLSLHLGFTLRKVRASNCLANTQKALQLCENERQKHSRISYWRPSIYSIDQIVIGYSEESGHK